jgi:lipoyl(octanoyl) transferase
MTQQQPYTMEQASEGQPVTIKWLGQQDYLSCWRAMQQFTNTRTEATKDEIWLLEHMPVFTQGQNGKPEHILAPGTIPIIQTDRGGQVTYHGPGQLMVYILLDLKRKKFNVRKLVTLLEQSVIDLLFDYGISAKAEREAPGVYVNSKKICSVGLRIRRGCSYHGIAFNIAMDLKPYSQINPCGFSDLKMTQLSELGGPGDIVETGRELINYLMKNLGYIYEERR